MNMNSSSSFRRFHVVSWNVRGLGDSDKCNVVRNVFSDAKTTFICIQESKLSEVNFFKAQTFLPRPFSSSFVMLPASGSRGGLITAWDPALFTLTSQLSNSFSLTTSFSCNASNIDFTITNVYGPSDHSASTQFLEGIRDTKALVSGAWILLGDFNLVRCAADKSNGSFNPNLADAFNQTIQDIVVSEVDLSDRRFTWTNNQAFPILAKLDRVFTNAPLDLALPMANLSSLPRPTSDHTPLLLSLASDIPKPDSFRLDNFLLRNESFFASITQGWHQAASCTAGQLVACIKAARAATKVWNQCNRAPLEITQNCQFLIQLFNYFEETRTLSQAEFQVHGLA